MPTIVAPEKHRSAWKQLFGQSEKDNFVEGIKNRRLNQDKADPQDFFFDPVSSELAPAVMMTRYLTKEGVPDLARRAAGTNAYKRAMSVMGPKAEEAANLFAERYPRIAAHVAPRYAAKGELAKDVDAVTKAGRRSAGYSEKTPIAYKKRLSSKAMEETTLHEGTHVAQELGLARFGGVSKPYQDVQAALESLGHSPRESYILNPYEVSARSTTSRKMGEKLKPHMVGPRLDSIIERLPVGSEHRKNLELLRGVK